jgi:hypothetical protein
MEEQDLNLIQEWRPKIPELDKLWKEHVDFEEELEQYNKRVYLTTQEEVERKLIQKKKLRGRDQIELILTKIRRGEFT